MTLRLAVAAALAEAEAAGLREVADVILTLARQLEEERQRADRLEDEAAQGGGRASRSSSATPGGGGRGRSRTPRR